MAVATKTEREISRGVMHLRAKKELPSWARKRVEGLLLHHIEGLVSPSELTPIYPSRNHRHVADGYPKRVVEVTQNNEFAHVSVEIFSAASGDRSGATVSGRLIEGRWTQLDVQFTETRDRPASGIGGPRAVHQALERFGPKKSSVK